MRIPSDALLRARLRVLDWARRRRLLRFLRLGQLLGACIANRSRLPDAIARYLVAGNHSTDSPRWTALALRQCKHTRRTRSGATKLERSALLKAPQGPNERGVLLLSFEAELEALVTSTAFEEIERRYLIAFLPTWQPAHSAPLFSLAARSRRPFVVMPASQADLALPAVLGRLCSTIPLQACNWAAAADFQAHEPRGVRDIDILMLANFGSYKRHWRLFEGLAQLPVRLRVVVAGPPWEGRTAASIRREARAFGVDERIEILPNRSYAEVAGLMRRARLLCAMSHKEGSYIAVAEALLAGTPVAMYQNALIGSKIYINDRSGILLDDHVPLGPQLLDALHVADTLNPAAWAASTLSAEVSAGILNSHLRRTALSHGEHWTLDTVEFCCRNFSFAYTDPASCVVLREDYEWLREQCNLTFSSAHAA